MKLERLDEYLTTATAVVVGVVAAYWCGLLAGGGDLGTLFSVFGILFFIGMVLLLRQYIWVLIPICWNLVGALPEVKYNPALRDVIIVAVTGATFVLMAFKILRERPKLQFLDFLIWSTLFYLVIDFFRNPVGVAALHSERIGGRPYLNVALTTAGFWVLSRASLPSKRAADWFLGSYLAVRILHGFLSVFAAISQSFGLFVVRFYGGIDVGMYTDDSNFSNSGEDTGRRGYLQQIGEPCVRWMISRWPPLDVINPLLALTQPFYLFRYLLFLGTLLTMTLAGFRSAMIIFLAMLGVSTWIQQGTRATVRFGVASACLLGLLILANPVLHLPLSVQRALSFLPGYWDPVATSEARASSEWRYYMWRQMLGTDKYIQNRWLGDGFGFSVRQLELIQLMRDKTHTDQETFLIVGQVHSGPISAIRYVGYIGCAYFILLLGTMSVIAIKLCLRAKGTPYFVLSLFLSLPIIVEPLNFLFIFGSYDYNLPEAILAAGVLKMLGNTLDRHYAFLPTVEEPGEPAAPMRSQRRFGPVRRPALVSRAAAR